MQLQQEKQIAKSSLLRKCGLLAHTSAAFLKNCCTEKLFSRLRLVLEKPPESGSARLGHIPSLPWESQLPLKPYLSLQPSDFEGNCDSSDSLLDFCCVSWCSFDLLRKCGLLAHTSAAFLKNCCTEKLFNCLRLVAYSHLLLFQKFSQLRFQQCPYCSIREILLPSSLSSNQLSPQTRIRQNAVCNHCRLYRVFLVQ